MTTGPAAVVVTVDLFSALLDSRAGGAAAVGEAAYAAWDREAKALQAACREWVPWADLALQAAVATGLGADGGRRLLASVPHWPLRPDVPAGLEALRRSGIRVGVLSNVDDDVLASTRLAPLVEKGLVDGALLLTSQGLGAYKPAPELYRRAAEAVRAACDGASLLHVASSARDVRGALEAGLRAVRLRRPDHPLDPDGPLPPHEVDELADVADLVGDVPPR